MPKPITPELLHERALHYLERYAASVSAVRQVLRRGLLRAARRGEEIPVDAENWVEDEIARLLKAGLLDDRSFAEMKVRSLRRSGASGSKVRQKLAIKGVKAALIDEALQQDEAGDDRAAAVIYARKKRLGPYTSRGDRVALRDKQIAALARAGFSLSIARWVVEAEDVAALEEATD